MPGPPFAFGAILVILALIVALFIPENPHSHVKSPSTRRTPPPLMQCDEDLAETSTSVCNNAFSQLNYTVINVCCPSVLSIMTALWLFISGLYSCCKVLSLQSGCELKHQRCYHHPCTPYTAILNLSVLSAIG